MVDMKYMGPVSQKILSPLVILSMEKTMITMVISELKSISRLKIFRETGPRVPLFVSSRVNNTMSKVNIELFVIRTLEWYITYKCSMNNTTITSNSIGNMPHHKRTDKTRLTNSSQT